MSVRRSNIDCDTSLKQSSESLRIISLLPRDNILELRIREGNYYLKIKLHCCLYNFCYYLLHRGRIMGAAFKFNKKIHFGLLLRI